MTDAPLIETCGLDIGYTVRRSVRLVQAGLDLTAETGNLTCLIGPNGSGKSTLLRTLAGLQPALGGCIRIGGEELGKQSAARRARLIALVLTDRIEAPRLGVEDLVMLGRNPYTGWLGTPSEADRRIVREALAQVRLEAYAHRDIDELSDGERGRALIAKALAQDTPAILLDEPTAHLDLPGRVEIMLLLRTLARQTRKAVLISTHELDLALQTADRIWLLSPAGGGVRADTPRALAADGSIQAVFGSRSFEFTGEGGGIRVKGVDD